MKSAYEIAMSRLESEAPTAKITDAQRAAIAEIDSQFKARIAERRIFLDGEIAKSTNQPLEVDQLRRQLASEITRLEEECESRKQKIRSGN